MADDDRDILRQLGGLMVWRCTEAIDPRGGFVFRTVGDPDGRCVEIIHSRNQMLLDRRLAIRVARAILEVAGVDADLDSDHPDAEVVEIVYGADGDPTGFAPYVSRTGTTLTDAEVFTRRETREPPPAPFTGLPPGITEIHCNDCRYQGYRSDSEHTCYRCGSPDITDLPKEQAHAG